MKQNAYPTSPVTSETVIFGYQNGNPQVTRNYPVSSILTASDNISNQDLVFDADHVVDFNDKRWTWIHGKELLVDFSYEPSPGFASFNIGGYGDAPTNVLWRLYNGNGIVSYEAYGDRSHLFTGAVTIQGNVNLTGIPISSSGLPPGRLWNDSGTLKIIP